MDLDASLYHSHDFADIMRSQGNLPLFFRYIDQAGKVQGMALGWFSTNGAVGR
ncbi:MAG: hypothetical protein MZV65_22440 [Chromatiales bacterium]|nr:hypothetical protein [Chromatiales bacterium]